MVVTAACPKNTQRGLPEACSRDAGVQLHWGLEHTDVAKLQQVKGEGPQAWSAAGRFCSTPTLRISSLSAVNALKHGAPAAVSMRESDSNHVHLHVC